MANRNEIVSYLSNYLQVSEFKDYCPNGLQVEGCSEINRIVTGVTASQSLIDRAIELKADAILVHHGYFWKGENETITGIKQKRIKALLQADINLLAYHLPLDCHAEVGNNTELARLLGITVTDALSINGISNLLWTGELSQACTAAELMGLLQDRLGRESLHLPAADNRLIKSLAWCTGGAQGYIEQAAALGVDAYISGEVSEQSCHLSRELNTHYFSAGHHATERYGVQALAAHLAEKFDIEVEYVEIENPV